MKSSEYTAPKTEIVKIETENVMTTASNLENWNTGNEEDY